MTYEMEVTPSYAGDDVSNDFDIVLPQGAVASVYLVNKANLT